MAMKGQAKNCSLPVMLGHDTTPCLLASFLKILVIVDPQCLVCFPFQRRILGYTEPRTSCLVGAKRFLASRQQHFSVSCYSTKIFVSYLFPKQLRVNQTETHFKRNFPSFIFVIMKNSTKEKLEFNEKLKFIKVNCSACQ